MLRLAATSVCDERGMRKQLSFGSKKKVSKRRLQEGDVIMGGRGETMRASPPVNCHGYIKRERLGIKSFF